MSRRWRRLVLPGLVIVAARATGAQHDARNDRVARRPIAAGVAARRSLEATRTSRPIVIDGRMDADEWRAAPTARDFIQRRPDPGDPARQRSEAAVLYDGDALYVGMRLFDTAPDSVAATLARRDFAGHSDWAHVIIDSYLDRRSAFRFGVNPAGVRSDGFLSDDSEEMDDASWDAVWQSAVTRDSAGWTAELRIPLSQLRFGARADSATNTADLDWGIQFVRDIARYGERSLWAPVESDAAGFVSHFGQLAGLRVSAPRRLEVLPYSVLTVDRTPGAGMVGAPRRGGAGVSFGADIKYGLTSDLMLTATVHPDFGQVEADPSQVNLTGGELFFMDRRPFFVEGSDIFRLSMAAADWLTGTEDLFYSRRIGRAPQGTTPDSARWSSMPDATTVLGAVKISGKTVGGWSLGVLDAVTAAEYAMVGAPSGARYEIPVEPLTNYAMGRATRNYRNGATALGVSVTATNRRLDGEELDSLRSASYVAGIDGRHRFANDRYLVSGSMMASYGRGSSAAIDRVSRGSVHYFQRPDASHLDYDPSRTSLSGSSSTLRVEKIAGGHLRLGLAGQVMTPGFDANDLGFHATSDVVRENGWIGWEQPTGSRLSLRHSVWLNMWNTATLGGEQTLSGARLNASFVWRNQWRTWSEIGHTPPGLSASALRGGPALAAPASTFGFLHVASDRRRRVSAELINHFSREHGTPTWSYGIEPWLTVRPSQRAELSLRGMVQWVATEHHYVAAPAAGASTQHVVGALDQTIVSLTARLAYTFTPDLTLQLYAQPFLSGGRYSRFREVGEPRATALGRRFFEIAPGRLSYDESADRYTVRGTGATPEYSFGDPSFDVGELRANAVLRWEYLPGSTAFLVWTHSRDAAAGEGELRLSDDARRLFSAPAANRLLLKVSFWVG